VIDTWQLLSAIHQLLQCTYHWLCSTCESFV